MRTAIGVGGAASGRGSFERVVEFAVEAEKLGVDVAWSAEAWGYDAVAPLAFLAARTHRLRLGSPPVRTRLTRPRPGTGSTGPGPRRGTQSSSVASTISTMPSPRLW